MQRSQCAARGKAERRATIIGYMRVITSSAIIMRDRAYMAESTIAPTFCALNDLRARGNVLPQAERDTATLFRLVIYMSNSHEKLH